MGSGSSVAVIALILFALFIILIFMYPGHLMVLAGSVMIIAGVLSGAGSTTVFQEIAAGLGLVGGFVAVGLGLAIIELVKIRRLLERDTTTA